MNERIKFDFHGVIVTGIAIKHFIDDDGDWFLVRLDGTGVDESQYVYCEITQATPISDDYVLPEIEEMDL
jgi:hypothetical protein